MRFLPIGELIRFHLRLLGKSGKPRMATMSGGGYAGRRHNLVEPLPLPASSSSLSPLAPPFVNPYSSPLAAPQPHSSSQFFSAAADWPSFSSSVPFRSDQGADGVVADPYYPQFYPDLPPVGAIGDGFKNPSSVYAGVDFGLWKGSFDEDSGKGKDFEPQFSWMDSSSSYKVSSIQEAGLSAGNHSNFEVDSHGLWHGKYLRSVIGEVHSGIEDSIMSHENPKATNGQDSSSLYSISPATFVAPKSFPKGMSYSGLPRSSSNLDPCASSGSNQSYDIPIAKPDSCFSYSFTLYPPRSTSTQLHSPSDVMNDHSLRNTDALVEHTASYMVDEAVNSPINQNNVKINQDNFSTGVNFAMNVDDFSNDKGTQKIADQVEGLSSKKKAATENSMSLLNKLKSNLKLRDSTMTIDSPGNFSAEPENFMSSSSETLDHLNLIVDSPCWKGASTLQQSLISAAETIVLESKAEFDYGNDLNKKNKLLEEYLEAPTPLYDTMFLKEIKISSCSEIQESVNLLDVHRKSDNDKKVAHSDINGNTNYTFCSKINTNHMNEKMEFGESETELPEIVASNGNMNDTFCSKINTNLMHEETEFTKSGIKSPEGTASIKLQPAERRADLESGQSSSSSSKKMLIKQLYSASVDLLSADCSNDITLDKHDIKLLWSAYNNIYLVLQDKQAFASSDCCACVEPNASVENDWLTQSTIRNIGKYTHYTEFNNNKSDVADIFTSRSRNSAHRKIDDVTTNAIEEHMARFFPERDESSQTHLYYKLWAEAEVANCKLKYDLQVALMKISETKMCKHQSRGSLAPSTTSSNPRSPHKLNVHDTSSKARDSMLDSSSQPCTKSGTDPRTNPPESFLAQKSNINSQEDLESSVMARFKILKGRKSEHNPSIVNGEERVSDSEGISSLSKQIVKHAVAGDDLNVALSEILPNYLKNVGFTESIVDPYAQERPNSWSSLVLPRTDLSLHQEYIA